MKFRSNIAHALLGALGVLAAQRTAGAVELELRVLVVATGGTEDDAGRALIEETLENMGVPFDVLDARSEALTADVLAESAERGRYNGIILTEAEALSANGTTALSAEEIATLHEYERDFGVRESVLSGFPATNAALGVDFGLDEVTAFTDLEARWTGRAGGTEIFEYVNTDNPLEVRDFSFTASVRDDGVGPVVEPLLVDADNRKQGESFLEKTAYRAAARSFVDLGKAFWEYRIHRRPSDVNRQFLEKHQVTLPEPPAFEAATIAAR